MQLGDRSNSSQLKSFSINGLFGFKDVKIPFDKEALILIAENGSGKTTILNTLYYSISCQFHKLSNLEFESVVIEFMSGENVEIKKSYLNSYYNRKTGEIMVILKKYLPHREVSKIVTELRKGYLSLSARTTLSVLIEGYGVSMAPQHLNRLQEFISKFGDKEKINREIIQKRLKESTLYFPTYRRIEEDLKNLGYKDDGFEKLSVQEGEGQLIQFGMNDVIKKFEEIKNKIKNSALVSLYQQQKQIDDSPNQFAQICNKYLHKKKIIYDEANVDISIIETRNNTPIDLSNLSSGEKQIISIFSQIYLEPSEDFIVLFDEPELSLSIEWQRNLLPDILKSNKCKLLLAVTHSPFIFDNELDLNAHDLDTFVKER